MSPKRRSARQTFLATKFALSILLPGIAGGVNAIGFYAVGAYTSHVTGHITGLGRELFLHHRDVVFAELSFIGCFILGVIVSTSLVAIARVRPRARHAIVLQMEATIIALCSIWPPHWHSPAVQQSLTALLCFAMGLQNALVTQAFGAMLRTTHLTGTCTDLGIETTRLAFWISAHLRYNTDKQLSLWRELTAEPEWAQLRTHFSVLCAYIGGALLGSALWSQAGQEGLKPFVLVLLALVVYDTFWGIRRLDL